MCLVFFHTGAILLIDCCCSAQLWQGVVRLGAVMPFKRQLFTDLSIRFLISIGYDIYLSWSSLSCSPLSNMGSAQIKWF